MRHWTLLGEASIPGSDKVLSLHQGKDDFFIRISGEGELMNTRTHGSEDALGALPCERLPDTKKAQVLIGGLGMGFTLAAVLANVGDKARVTVAELIPEVVEWNHGPLGARSGYPLNDPRTDVFIGDVATLLKDACRRYDVIALDVDNGPEGMTKSSNSWLYSTAGIIAAQKSLSPTGILAYWSAAQDAGFHDRLRRCGFLVDEVMVRGHGKKGPKHYIWLASISG